MSKESRALKKELRMARKQAERDRDRWERELGRQRIAAQEQTSAYNQRTDALTSQLEALRIQNQESIASITSGYEQQLAQSSANSQKQIASLNDLIIQNQNAFQQQYDALESQRVAAEAAYEEQKRVSTNLANAYVPESQATATAPTLGGTAALNTKRKAKDNELSSLSIVSNVPSGLAGSNANPTAGLQIA